MVNQEPSRRRRAAAVLVACGGVLAVLLASPVSLRGDVPDTAALVVAGLVGAAASHEVASRAFRYVVLYPLLLLGPTVAALGSVMRGDQRAVAVGDGCRVRLEHEGYVGSAWVTVDIAEAFEWTPFEIDRASGRIENVGELGSMAASGAWKPFKLADLTVSRAAAAGCAPSFTYGEQARPVAWVPARRAR